MSAEDLAALQTEDDVRGFWAESRDELEGTCERVTGAMLDRVLRQNIRHELGKLAYTPDYWRLMLLFGTVIPDFWR